jgi:glutamate synthase (NADPH/NADH) small chain
VGSNGRVEALECVRMEWVTGTDGRQHMQEVAGSEFQLKADLVFLAMGFVGPRKSGFTEQAGVEFDVRGAIRADTVSYQTSMPGIFTCGDMRRGQSLVVWAIREGRQCAHAVDTFLMGTSRLPR